MRIEKVEDCFCGQTPIILVHNCIGCVEYCVKCPKCGRGGNWYPTCFTTYKAIKHWNDFQKRLKGEIQ